MVSGIDHDLLPKRCSEPPDECREWRGDDPWSREHGDVLMRGELDGSKCGADTTLCAVAGHCIAYGLPCNDRDLGLVLDRGAHHREGPDAESSAEPEEGVEIPPSRERGGRARDQGTQALMRSRPLRRRRFMRLRPARVRWRARKPILRLRRRLFGW